ncbi:MAG: DNA-binding protein WhiA [Firmicutes bacterium]|uniref:Probable cell division protein WhiA n=1 Tax=Candidatus Scybalomonas excrementavium TaxID=2840943 RepID=A0A9D9I1P4_9FIRM|nr:DNA-binding protein WhiA [Candidatus Scybalomonas excrementavium]
MSFSSEVKEEIARIISPARHCQIAEIAAIISLCGRVQISEFDTYKLLIQTENAGVARKYYSLLKKAFQITASIIIKRNLYLKKSHTYLVKIDDHEQAVKVLQAIKLMDPYGQIQEEFSQITHFVLQRDCCKRAFIRGAFLASGSISDPEKNYHFEIVCTNEEKAKQLQEIMNTFHLDAKIVLRKKYYVVYIKEGARLVDILNVMEAHVALMKLENVRILKDMRNSVNRRVNCETANINKTVSAAMKQVEDIKYIQDTIGFSELSEGLAEIAKLRLSQPEATLKELGSMLNPPVGKSGVNHRLRKLSNIADDLRASQES